LIFEAHFCIFCNFAYKPKYVCMWKITTTTWIIFYWTFQFFSFKFVPCKCHLQKIALKKSQSPFSFFGTPIVNGPNLPIFFFALLSSCCSQGLICINNVNCSCKIFKILLLCLTTWWPLSHTYNWKHVEWCKFHVHVFELLWSPYFIKYVLCM
jgi:hypothetical protein